MKRQDRMDRLIETALKAELTSAPVPPLNKEEAWANISQVLLDEGRKRAVFHSHLPKIIGATAMVAVLFFMGILFQPQVGSAFNWVKEIFLSTAGEVTELQGRVGENTSEPAPGAEFDSKTVETDTVVTREILPLEKAQSVTNFEIVIPTAIPVGYALDGIEVPISEEGESKEAILHYSNGTETIQIRETSIRDKMDYGMGVDSGDVQTKEVTLHGEQAFLFYFKDDSKKLVWERQQIFFMLDSFDHHLHEEELLKMAATIK